MVVSDGLPKKQRTTYCEKVDPAHDENHDAGRYDHAPESKAERFFADGFLVEITEHVDPENDHCKSQGNKAVGRA
jgi:hypothetical protein